MGWHDDHGRYLPPNHEGWLVPEVSGTLNHKGDDKTIVKSTKAVHHMTAKIILQILHSGRYSYHPFGISQCHQVAYFTLQTSSNE